jgi:hypothetical protein
VSKLKKKLTEGGETQPGIRNYIQGLKDKKELGMMHKLKGMLATAIIGRA